MRIIDADKLYPDCMTKDGKLAISQSQLANAPTVEPFEPDYVGAERVKARQRGYEQGYHEGMKIGKTLNPKIKQGEWKRGEFGSYCSICGYAEYRYLGTGPKHDHNFCPECGADMRKGGAV